MQRTAFDACTSSKQGLCLREKCEPEVFESAAMECHGASTMDVSSAHALADTATTADYRRRSKDAAARAVVDWPHDHAEDGGTICGAGWRWRRLGSRRGRAVDEGAVGGGRCI